MRSYTSPVTRPRLARALRIPALSTGWRGSFKYHPHDLVAGLDLSPFQDMEIEAGPAVRDKQRGHLRLVHADADPVAGDARLRHFEQSAPNTVMIADAHLVVGQTFDGEVLAEFPISEVGSAELALPIAVGFDLVDEDGPVLAAVPG
jgi:hypothetical protein